MQMYANGCGFMQANVNMAVQLDCGCLTPQYWSHGFHSLSWLAATGLQSLNIQVAGGQSVLSIMLLPQENVLSSNLEQS